MQATANSAWQRAKGWRFCTFACSQDDVELVFERLRAFREVEPTSIVRTAHGVAFTIELVLLDRDGDGPAAEQRIAYELSRVIGRHRLPTDPPEAT